MDLTKIRADFPVFQNSSQDKTPVYFDSACTSLKPRSVIDAVSEYYSEYSGCAGRSDHLFATKTQNAIQVVRNSIKGFISASSEKEILFTTNTTGGINLLAYQLEQQGGVVIVSDKEHNSNFLPWLRLKQKAKIQLEIIPTNDKSGLIDIDQLETVLKKHTSTGGFKLVSIFYTSNLDGSFHDIPTLSKLVHEHNFLFHVDAAQAIPHIVMDVKSLDIDFMTFSGHKMLGPTGIGVVYGRENLLREFEPLTVGGGTPLDVTYDHFEYADLPNKFEAGIQNYTGMIGLGAAVRYLQDIHTNYEDGAIHRHTISLNQYVTDNLLKLSDRVQIYGPSNAVDRPTILSFGLQGMHHQQVGFLLNEKNNIMVRAGRHCVHGYCNARNIPGTVRVSFYIYNTMDECSELLNTMEEILKI